MLFPWWSVSSDLFKQFAKVFEVAGCTDLHFHDLRHEAIYHLFERTTLQPMMIARISGHSTPKLLQRYLSLRGSDLAEQYDPQANYDLMDPENFKVGEVRRGVYLENTWKVGKIEGEVFHYNGEPAGKLEGLTTTRYDRPPTQCQLVKHESC
jgi:hypothetical protein